MYDGLFFDYVDAGALRSARRVVAVISSEIEVKSVLDVGCGRGGWAATWKQLTEANIVGVDGDYVDRKTLKIELSEFRVQDLNRPFDLGERFDLVQSLEVAEHLMPASSSNFVASLVKHGDIVLFSAAVPGQGGTQHINERPLEFWRDLFAQHGYEAYDFVRSRIVANHEVEPWYRYNSILYASSSGAKRLSEAVRLSRVPGETKLVEGGSVGWRIRRAIIRCLPRPLVDQLAVINASAKHFRVGGS